MKRLKKKRHATGAASAEECVLLHYGQCTQLLTALIDRPTVYKKRVKALIKEYVEIRSALKKSGYTGKAKSLQKLITKLRSMLKRKTPPKRQDFQKLKKHFEGITKDFVNNKDSSDAKERNREDTIQNRDECHDRQDLMPVPLSEITQAEAEHSTALLISPDEMLIQNIKDWLKEEPIEIESAPDVFNGIVAMGKGTFEFILYDGHLSIDELKDFCVVAKRMQEKSPPAVIIIGDHSTFDTQPDLELRFAILPDTHTDPAGLKRCIKSLQDPLWDPTKNSILGIDAKVLIVSSDTKTTDSLVKTLNEDGLSVVVVNCGNEGTKKARELVPDLIILDEQLEDIRGSTLCKHWREEPVISAIPVLIMAKVRNDDEALALRTRSFRAGAFGYLSKPIQSAELLAQAHVLIKLAKMHSELQEHVVTLSVTNMELQETKNLLEQKSRELEKSGAYKSEFLAKMSHELRTPLTAMLGFAQTLLQDGLSPQERIGAVKTIIRNGEHLMELINDILDISKIEAGKLDIEKTTCSPIEILKDIKALMKIKAEQKGLNFWINCEGEIPESIYTDPLRLKQILINLVGNAIKFTLKGNVRINVSCDVKAQKMYFQVVDTGIGIPKEKKERLFQAFEQGDTSVTRRFGGTGLGLTISLQLVELLGGTIEVDSIEGLGSSFKFSVDTGDLSDVPLRIIAQDSWDEEPFDNKAKIGETKLVGKVLFAEDNPDNQRLIRIYMDKIGVDYTLVDNGKQAVEEALLNDYDVVFLDMQMPIMDGYEAVALLRKKNFTRPIIALTANDMQDEVYKCLNAGCTKLLSKPYNWDQLFDVLREYLPEVPVDNDKPVPLHEIPLSSDSPMPQRNIREKNNQEHNVQTVQVDGSDREVFDSDFNKHVNVKGTVSRPLEECTSVQSDSATSVDVDPFRVSDQHEHTSSSSSASPLQSEVLKIDIDETLSESDEPDAIVSEIYETCPELRELIIEFVEGIDDYILQLDRAYQNGDIKALRAVAHDIAGVCGMYGYPACTEAAKELRAKIIDEDSNGIKLALQKLKKLLLRVRAGLDVMTGKDRDSSDDGDRTTRDLQLEMESDSNTYNNEETDVITSELIELKPELAPFIEEFAKDLSTMIVKLDNALLKENWGVIIDISNELAGTASLYGFPKLSETAKSLEETLLAGNTSEVRRFIDDIKYFYRSLNKCPS